MGAMMSDADNIVAQIRWMWSVCCVDNCHQRHHSYRHSVIAMSLYSVQNCRHHYLYLSLKSAHVPRCSKTGCLYLSMFRDCFADIDSVWRHFDVTPDSLCYRCWFLMMMTTTMWHFANHFRVYSTLWIPLSCYLLSIDHLFSYVGHPSKTLLFFGK